VGDGCDGAAVIWGLGGDTAWGLLASSGTVLDSTSMDCANTLLAGGGLAPGCAGALLSKVLGYAVVAGSAALKLPQVRGRSPPPRCVETS
jgi:hypothetical protein